jgi:hypothetical protein
MKPESLEENRDDNIYDKGDESVSGALCYIDVTLIVSALLKFYAVADKKIKKAQIEKIFASADWYRHYCDKKTGNSVFSESPSSIEHKHELDTAICLAQIGYDILFAPKGMFDRHDKRFDVFIIKGTVMLKADLKAINSQNPDTISNRIKEGSYQASRIVLHILSDVSAKKLIQAMRSGCYKSSTLKEIFLLYKGSFYVLPINLITSNRIFSILK